MYTMLTNRGDVVLVPFPDSNRTTYKRRPALVVRADGLNTGIAQTIVALITSNLSRAGHPSRWIVRKLSPEGHKMGLRTDSVVMTDNVVTIRDSQVERIVGRCSDMSHVDAALRHTLNI